MDDLILRVSSPSYVFNTENNETLAKFLTQCMFPFSEDHDFRVDVVVGEIIHPVDTPRGHPT